MTYTRSDDMKPMVIRAPVELKNAFHDACKNNDSNASRELREFMKKYIAQHGQKKLL